MKDEKVYSILISLLGIVGLYGCFITAFPLAINIGVALCGFVILLGLVGYVTYSKKKNVLLIFLVCFVVYSILNFNGILNGARALYNGIVDTYSANDSYVFNKYTFPSFDSNGSLISVSLMATKTLLYLFTLYALIVMVLLRQRVAFLLMLVLTVSLFSSMILYQTVPFFPCIAMVIAFCLILLFLAIMKRYTIPQDQIGSLLKRLSMGALCISFVLMLLLPQAVFKKSLTIETLRMKISMEIESLIIKNNQAMGEIDLRSAGNRLYSHTNHLQVTSSIKQQLYLKEFSGGVFEQDKWTQLDESRYDNPLLDIQSIYEWIPSTQKSLPDERNLSMITITDERSRPYYAPQPYFLNEVGNDTEYVFDEFFKAGKGSYTYEFWNNEAINNLGDSKRNLTYEAFANVNYTAVPYEIRTLFDELDLFRLMRKGESHYQIAYPMIQDYLAQQATYTLSPGDTPEETEFIEYFLTENKKGYCVHFATTATMLFRYLNIPARYVEGYRVDVSSFDDENTAKVKDSDAHAWVEVFDEKKGWIPLEVTPAAPVEEEDPTENTDGTTTTPNQTQTPNGTDDTQQGTNDDPAGNTNGATADIMKDKADTKSLTTLLYTIGALVGLVAVIVQRSIRYHNWNKRMRQSDRRKAVCRIQRYLDKLSTYRTIDLTPIRPILDKASYSQHQIEEEEYLLVYHFMLETRTQLRKQLRIVERCKCYLWDAYM